VTGWAFDQQPNQQSYEISFNPYMTSNLNIKSQIKLDRLIQHVMIFDLPSFKVSLNFSSMFSKTGQICTGVGW